MYKMKYTDFVLESPLTVNEWIPSVSSSEIFTIATEKKKKKSTLM